MTNDHLDDEATSAVLDGASTLEEAAHLEACQHCTMRLETFRDAALLVGSSVPPPNPARRDAAVAAALHAAPMATVTPMTRRVPPAWLGVAAAIVIAVGGAAVLVTRDGDRGGDQVASGDAATDTDTAATFAPDTALEMQADAFSATAAPVEGGDLGDLRSIDLAATVRTALEQPPAAATTAAPSGGASSATGSSSAGSSERDAAASCEDPARGVLVFRATGTLDGVSVLVLAYDGEDGRRVAYVIEPDSCTVRDAQDVSP